LCRSWTRDRTDAGAAGPYSANAPRRSRDGLGYRAQELRFPLEFRDCLLAGYQCVILDRGARVAGYAILSIAAGEAHILNLCVDPAHRAHGYGEQLLNEILGRARVAEVEEIFLEVRPSNETAMALYKKKGFHQIANRPKYYQAPLGREDAAVLSKKLTNEY
jgi:ribosomal-protein-alanine N-acetyltransferase